MYTLSFFLLAGLLATLPLFPAQAQSPQPTQQEPCVPAPVAQAPVATPSPTRSMVTLKATRQSYNHLQPWQKLSTQYSNGFAVYLGNGQFLTVETMVRDATFVELVPSQGGRSVSARVVYSDPEANLALIGLPASPESSAFLEGLVPLPVGSPQALNASVELWQYSNEGLPLTTPGIFRSSTPFSSGNDFPGFLACDIQATLTPESSSATIPVVVNDKLVGISLNYRQQTLTAVSATVINNFLQNAKSGRPGFPTLGISISELTDPIFREYLKLDRNGNGIYISQVVPRSCAARAGLQKGDVLEELDGRPIDNRGLTQDASLGPVPAALLMHDSHKMGDTISVKIRRNGEPLSLNIQLDRSAVDKDLVSRDIIANACPSYIIYGGLVFQKLTSSFIDTIKGFNDNNLPTELIKALNNKETYVQEGREELVVIGIVLPTPATLGYNTCGFCIVNKVNGTQVKSLKHLSELLDQPTASDLIEIETNKAPFKLYLSRSTCHSSNEALRRRALPVLRRLNSSLP